MIIHDLVQYSDEYWKVRNAKPSSSRFGDLITGGGLPSKSLSKYANELATEKYLGRKIDDGFNGNKHMDRGTDLESEARADYQMVKQVRVKDVGYITDDLMRYGCSTDGLIGDDGVLEIKNLISTTFFAALVYFKKNGKTEPKYKPQIMGELFVSERKWCDLFLYNPSFPHPIIERFYPEKEYFNTLEKQLMSVILERNRLLELVK